MKKQNVIFVSGMILLMFCSYVSATTTNATGHYVQDSVILDLSLQDKHF